MGSPELPDPNEHDLPMQIPQNVQHVPMASDESDDNMDTYDGYQLLNTNAIENNFANFDNDNDSDNDDLDNNDDDSPDSVTISDTVTVVEPTAPIDTNLPHIESADAEIERQVWNEPRPQSLQIELDNTKTAQILNAMANFQLPNAAVPDWAAGVPEERWKADLLQRIRGQNKIGAKQQQQQQQQQQTQQPQQQQQQPQQQQQQPQQQ